MGAGPTWSPPEFGRLFQFNLGDLVDRARGWSLALWAAYSAISFPRGSENSKCDRSSRTSGLIAEPDRYKNGKPAKCPITTGWVRKMAGCRLSRYGTSRRSAEILPVFGRGCCARKFVRWHKARVTGAPGKAPLIRHGNQVTARSATSSATVWTSSWALSSTLTLFLRPSY